MTDREGTAAAPVSRVEQLEEAVRRICRTQVYEEPGNPARGLNEEFVAVLMDARRLVEHGTPLPEPGACRHDFGMLGACVKCGAEEVRDGR